MKQSYWINENLFFIGHYLSHFLGFLFIYVFWQISPPIRIIFRLLCKNFLILKHSIKLFFQPLRKLISMKLKSQYFVFCYILFCFAITLIPLPFFWNFLHDDACKYLHIFKFGIIFCSFFLVFLLFLFFNCISRQKWRKKTGIHSK